MCREIAHYLVLHSEAADTVSGIAEWWIKRDIGRTSEALTRLRTHGVVRSHVIQDATSVYTLTRSRPIREILRQYLDLVHAQRPAAAADGDRTYRDQVNGAS